MALEREHHVVRGERRAVMEHHALAQLDGPNLGVAALHRGREVRQRIELFVEHRQAVVEHEQARVVGGVVGVRRIERVLGGRRVVGSADRTAALRFVGVSARHQQAARADAKTRRKSQAHRLTSRPACRFVAHSWNPLIATASRIVHEAVSIPACPHRPHQPVRQAC